MNIIEMKNLKYKDNISIALGNFDGVHRGHKVLIQSMIRDSKELGIKSSVLLFENHTKSIIKGQAPELLTDNLQREELLAGLEVDILYTMNFNLNLRNLSPEEFVRDILVEKLGVKAVTVGYNYKFGYGAQASVEDFKILADLYGFKLTVIDPISLDGEVVSSTKIRDYIKNSNIVKANKMLGREYILKGKVVTGKNLGHKLGFPTANIELMDNFIIPKSGVYYTKTRIMDREYVSVTSIGRNPTFNEDEIKIESHILDFNENIYGQDIEVKIIEYLREENKFKSLDELKNQIKIDIKRVRDKQ